MSQKRKGRPEDNLEPNIIRGGKATRARRCQMILASGVQCGKQSVAGKGLCTKHGPGTRARPGGRPPTHGLYTKVGLESISSLREKVLEADIALDNTDAELATLKATLWYLLEQDDQRQLQAKSIDSAFDQLEDYLANPEALEDYRAASQIRQIMRRAAKDYRGLRDWLLQIEDACTKIGNLVKVRAETTAKVAEVRAKTLFLDFAAYLRGVLTDHMDIGQLAAFDDRARREIFAPNRLEYPSD